MTFLSNSIAMSGDTYVGDIGHSLRLRSAASAYLSRTPGAGSQTKWAISLWVKRGLLSYTGSWGITTLFGWRHTVAGQSGALAYNGAGDKLQLVEGATTYRVCSAVERDPTSHEHIYLVWDSNNATQSLRCQIWRNGVLATYSTELAISLGAVLNANTAVIHTLGADFPTTGVRDFFDGYISRVAFVDNAAPAVTEFGYLNTETNAWVTKTEAEVKAVVNAGGTNSFMMEFKDATSLTTLGYDNSSKGNNWTLTNFSLTAGTTYDHMLDVPGNSFATLNPLLASVNNGVLSNANLTAALTYSSQVNNFANMPLPTAGKWYWEPTVTSAYGVSVGIRSVINSSLIDNAGVGGYSYYNANGNKLNRATASAYGTAWYGGTRTDVVGIAFDADTRELSFYLNGVSQGVAFTVPAGEYYPASSHVSGSGSHTEHYNFGQRPFAYAPPAGFKALCQANLPADGTVIVSGSFTGNVSADGPCVWMNGTPKTLTINSNAVTFGTHADRLATGFKIRTASTSYNSTGTNTWTATIDSNFQNIFKYNNAEGNP